MRKIFSIFTLAILVVLSSCELNEIPEFEDKHAFVAFDRGSMSFTEDAGRVQIPVTLASVSGISSTVTYTVIDGTAKEGVNFNLVDGAATLTFDANNRTQYIEIDIIEIPDVFTGDLRFQIQLSDEGTVKPSAEDACRITIVDLDHPLSSIIGTYDVAAPSAFGGVEEFEMTLHIDDEDISVVWFQNLAGVGTGPGFYGVVNDDLTEITVPLGQISTTNTTSNGDGNIYLYGVTPTVGVQTSGNMIIEIEDDGATLWFRTLAPAKNAGGEGYFEALIPPYSATKID